VVGSVPSAWLLVLLALAPLVAMAAVLVARARLYAEGSRDRD
jgi:hypothetical protein